MSAALDRIAALLAKAERTEIEAEADAYLMKAQQLATLASVDLAVARARTARREARQQPESRTTTIGEKGRRGRTPPAGRCSWAIAHANDAKVDVAANSTYVIAPAHAGRPRRHRDHVRLAGGAHGPQRAGLRHGRQAGGRETYLAVAARTRRREHRPHTAQTARAAFYRAYVERMSERLSQARPWRRWTTWRAR